MRIWFDKSDIQQMENVTDAQATITAIDNVIQTLLGAAAKAALTGNMTEYKIDTGQTKQSVVYKDVTAITASITSLNNLKQYYLNAINGRVSRTVDAKNLPITGTF